MSATTLRRLLLIATLLLPTACHDTPKQWADDPYGNFNALWTIIDQHYSFFEHKNIDWDEIGNRYRNKLSDNISQQELFDLCGTMLKELHDGHVNLIAPHDVSRYWIWEQFPENYDRRLIEQYYLRFDYRRTCGIDYQILPDNFGYMRYADFASDIGEGNLDLVLNYLATTDGLIIDVRSNGGGYLNNVETLVSRFIDRRTLAGSICHKTGPGHNDFSTPYAYYYSPPDNHVRYLKPVAVLANRGSFSATNNFVAIMKSLPQVTIVGDTTGGGSGLPFTSELPNGWTVRFSACPIKDPAGNDTEHGVAPDILVNLDPAMQAQGVDNMLETAIRTLRQ